MRIYIVLYYALSLKFTDMAHVQQGDHTVLPANHTRLYSTAARRHHPLADNHCTDPRRDGQVELTWVAGYILR